ncbi:MFS transporter [Methylopila sp. Yamaguchi]|uniref:MFS transporter n=1 Tax=Methylopila sp. Yamaguchi TaxID=1437817 RepID=UPI000CC567B5|nr:MFS transporter [Methylopila sp. Yamaguchi]GBD48803.1 arabinose efflux permease family protein [Methylopila sp. Yamaguchi]
MSAPSDLAQAPARPLTARDGKTLGLAALGGALEFYDFVVFVFFATVIGQLFFPPEIPEWLRQAQTFALFAVGYLVRPLSGLVMAHVGDRVGRKRVFAFTILLMGLATLGIGLLPTYATIGVAAPLALLALRVAQGAAIGGEAPGAWVFVAEHAPPNRVGLACGVLTAGLTVGILLGSLAAGVVNRAFTPETVADWAWRLPFLLGGVFGLASVYLRRLLDETPVFQEMKARSQVAAELPLKAALRDHGRGVVVSMLLTWLLSAAIVVVILMTPALLERLHGVPIAAALSANAAATVGLAIGCVLAGALIDRIGAGPFFTFGAPVLGVCVWTFYAYAPGDPALLTPLYALAGLAVGVVAGVPYVMVRAFPAAVRFTGVSFSYNVAYAVFGGLTPVLLPFLLRIDPFAHAHYVAALSALGCAVGLWMWRRGRP